MSLIAIQIQGEKNMTQQLEQTLAERGGRYGDFSDNARLSQHLQDEVRCEPGWLNLSEVQREAIQVIMAKISRIVNGDPNYRDNWHDIAGYAKLAEDRCGAELGATRPGEEGKHLCKVPMSTAYQS